MRRRVYSGKPGRRILSLVLSLMMVLSCLSVSAIDVPADGPAPYSATDNIFDGTFTGDCSVDQDAGTITVNRLEDNNHVISEVTADAFILEADVSFPDGYVDAGFIFGVTDREAPGTDWTQVLRFQGCTIEYGIAAAESERQWYSRLLKELEEEE